MRPPPSPGLAGLRFDAVLFDLDGTLVDSTDSVQRCWLQWSERYAVDPAELAGFHGVPSAAVIATFLPPDRRVEAGEWIRELELSDAHSCRALPGAVQAVRSLAEAGAAMAVVTSGTRDLAEARLAAAGIPVPDVFVTADQVTHGKPHPEPYLTAAERLGVDPASCLVVEDAPAGIEAGRAAGARVLAVVTTTPAEVLGGLADAVVPSLAHLTLASGPDGIRVAPAAAP